MSDLDAIREDVAMAARSAEMARHVALDHTPELLDEMERLRAEVERLTPRRVETAEELEALPEGAAILRTDDDSTESGVVTVGGYIHWSQCGPQDVAGLAREVAHRDDLTVRVLWPPGAAS